MAHELAARGLARGDRLCVHLANRVEFIDLFLACARLGVVFVPINILYRERELRHIVTDAEPKAVVVEPKDDATYPDAAPLWDVRRAERRCGVARDQPSRRCRSTDEDAALIVYTSGTTGSGERRGALARQPRGQRPDADVGVANHRRRPLPRDAAALPRARARATEFTVGSSADAACGFSSGSTIARRPA